MLTGIILAAIAVASHGQPHQDPPEVTARIERPDGTDLIVVEAGTTAFGAEHGDTIVVRFPGSDGLEEADFQDRCDAFGGKLRWSIMWTGGHYGDGSGEFVCEDVDF